MSAPPQAGRSARRPRNRLVRSLASVRLGILLLALILLYASIGSALPHVRGALELTEMQVFSHWLFVALVGAFCVSLIAATLFRCRWSVPEAGAIIVHIGLLLLTGGATWYFASKVEGNVLLFSPSVVVFEVEDGAPREMGRLLAESGQTWAGATRSGGEPVRVRVEEVRAAGLQQVAAATVEVQLGNDLPMSVLLSPGTSWSRVGDRVVVELRTHLPTTTFLDNDLAALFYRKLGEPDSARRCSALPGLPLHRERYLDAGDRVLDTQGQDVPSKRSRPHLQLGPLDIFTDWIEPWRLPNDVEAPDLPFGVTVTGYLPYVVDAGYDIMTRDGRRVDRSEMGGLDPAQVDVVPRVPRVVPVELRRPRMGRGSSAIRLEFRGWGSLAGWTDSRWCFFSPYPDVDATPIHVSPPGTDGVWELIYGTYERDLGASLIGRKLSVEFFPGRRSVAAWRSDFVVQTAPDTPPAEAAVYTNSTYPVGEFTLYQSGAATDHWSWTILGVSTRRGIWAMTIGCVLITVGSLYAFYVKPLLRRKREERDA